MSWINQTQHRSYQTFLLFEEYPKPQPVAVAEPVPIVAEPEVSPERLAYRIDRIENRYSILQIRQLYARYLAGRKKSASLEDIGKHYQRQALEADIDEAVRELARNWESFTTYSGT